MRVIIMDSTGKRHLRDIPDELIPKTNDSFSIRSRSEKNVGNVRLITKWGSDQVETPQTITHLFCKD